MLDIQTCEKVERAHQEWLVALDSFKEQVFRLMKSSVINIMKSFQKLMLHLAVAQK
jgi:hypothetical protein